MLRFLRLGILILFLAYCARENTVSDAQPARQYIKILGIAQDGGYPHINIDGEWADLKDKQISREPVVSLGLVDTIAGKKWLFEATPDMPEQLFDLNFGLPRAETIVDGVFLTHAHIGHYTGLMHFGREAMGGSSIPVYAMPKMKAFLENNGPWSQLVSLNNIEIREIRSDSALRLSKNLQVVPFLVPHRDEFSETVGYQIISKDRKALFIPDINKWKLWNRSIVEEVKSVDYAFIDATFFQDGEIPRPMSEVPHPFIQETIKLFENESVQTRSKIVFIHFNHSNPAILKNHRLKDSVMNLGFRFAERGQIYPL